MGLNLLYMYQDKPALLPWWPEPYSHLCKEEESALTRLRSLVEISLEEWEGCGDTRQPCRVHLLCHLKHHGDACHVEQTRCIVIAQRVCNTSNKHKLQRMMTV